MDSQPSESVEADPPERSFHHVAGVAHATLENRQRAVKENWAAFRLFLNELCCRLAGGSFSVRIVSDRTIRRFNKQYRGMDEPTDVLSFPADEAEKTGYLGDILISAETAQSNAERYGLTLLDEVRVLALHGVLHLLGYDHETDRGIMARQEKIWSARFGLPVSLTGRAASKRAANRKTVFV